LKKLESMDVREDEESQPVCEVEYFDTPSGQFQRKQAWTHACMPRNKRRSVESIEPIVSDDEKVSSNEEESEETPPPRRKKKKGKSVPGAPVFSLDPDNLEDCLRRPLTKGAEVRAYVMRNKRMGMYQMHLEEGGKAILLAVKNRKAKRSINYKISVVKGEHSLIGSSNDHIGKVRGNMVGQEWILYDNGLNPSKSQGHDTVRREFAAMWYPVRTQGPRIMQVGLPKLDDDGAFRIIRPMNNRESMMQRLKSGTGVEVTNLINKTPQYDPVKKIHQLNFHGRVTEASIKNFMLTDNGVNDRTLLLFGRVDKDKFTLDFSHPLSPLQAFGIALSQLLRPLR